MDYGVTKASACCFFNAGGYFQWAFGGFKAQRSSRLLWRWTMRNGVRVPVASGVGSYTLSLFSSWSLGENISAAKNIISFYH